MNCSESSGRRTESFLSTKRVNPTDAARIYAARPNVLDRIFNTGVPAAIYEKIEEELLGQTK